MFQYLPHRSLSSGKDFGTIGTSLAVCLQNFSHTVICLTATKSVFHAECGSLKPLNFTEPLVKFRIVSIIKLAKYLLFYSLNLIDLPFNLAGCLTQSPKRNFLSFSMGL